jgi:hypothetical protein
MQEIVRMTDGRCALIVHTEPGPRGEVFAATVVSPDGLLPPHHLRQTNAFGLWRVGLFIEETDGFQKLSVHKNYDPAALKEDVRSLSTLLGQGVSLLTHLERGGRLDSWERPTPEGARELFRKSHGVVSHLEQLVEHYRAGTRSARTSAETTNPGAGSAAPKVRPIAERGTRMPENEMNSKPEPLYKLSGDGPVRAAVWLNKSQTTQEEYFTVSFYRYYRDKQEQWKTTTSFRAQDLPSIAQLAEKAQKLIQNEQTARQGVQHKVAPSPELDHGPEIDL